MKEKIKNMRKGTLVLLLTGTLLCGTFLGAFLISFSNHKKMTSSSVDLSNQVNEKTNIEQDDNTTPIVEEEKREKNENEEIKNPTVPEVNTKPDSSNPLNSVSSSNESINQRSTSSTESSSLQDADTTIMAYFNKTKDDLEDVNLREKAKENFISIVDFLFYGGEIKGYTFDELTTKAKLKVLQIALTIDKKIDSYFPDYKEKISKQANRVYTNIKETVVLKYLEITASICAKDADICASAKNDFQDMKKSFSITWDFLKTLASKGSANIKSWYEIYSGK